LDKTPDAAGQAPTGAIVSAIECPHCRSAGNNSLVRTPGNLFRAILDLAAAVLVFALSFDGLSGAYVPATRKCNDCGRTFSAPREPRRPDRKLDECRRCGYSLIGNTSGVCPECGRKLTARQIRVLREEATARNNADS